MIFILIFEIFLLQIEKHQPGGIKGNENEINEAAPSS